jgi:hypothetical protein
MAKDKPSSATAAEAQALESRRRHSKRPEPATTPWTRENVCAANGHNAGGKH